MVKSVFSFSKKGLCSFSACQSQQYKQALFIDGCYNINSAGLIKNLRER